MVPAKRPDTKSRSQSRRGGVAKLSRSSSRLISKAVRAKGFAEAEIVTRWGRIVGSDLARATVPLKLVFPRGARQGAALHVRTESAFAPIVQQRASSIIEKVNRYLGYAAVARLEVKQGPLPRTSIHKGLEKGDLNPDQQSALRELVGEGELSPLKEAVRNLGELVLSRPKGK